MIDKCRICLKEQRIVVDLFEKKNSVTLSAQIMSIARVQIHSNDNLPRGICKTCLRKLKCCIKFIEQCEKSDLELHLHSKNIAKDRVILNKFELRVFKTALDTSSNLKVFGTEGHKSNSILQDTNEKNTNSNDSSEEVKSSIENNCCEFKTKPNIVSNNNIFETTDEHNISETDEYSEIRREMCKSSTNAISNDNFLETNLKERNTSDENHKIKKTSTNRHYQCPICGKIISSRFRLKTHMATHSDDRPFGCNYCDRKFSIRENLKVHLRTHTGEKPLKCTVCGKKFAHSAGLATHKRKHTGHTPYKCNICPKSFRTYTSMQYHTKIAIKHTAHLMGSDNRRL